MGVVGATGVSSATAQRVAGGFTLIAALLAIGTVAGIGPLAVPGIDGQAAAAMVGFLVLSSVLGLALAGDRVRLAFLLGLFTMLVGWRVSALAGATAVMVVLIPAFLAYVAAFLAHVRVALATGAASVADVHLSFFRLYLGLDLVPHFTEKLFAGPGVRADDVEAFAAMGMPGPLAFVLLAGVVELAAAIGVGLGLLTRLAAPATVLYLMIATVIGGHFTLGFIWASPGGGWEYPVLWSVLILSFAFAGGRWLSLDDEIDGRLDLPPVVRRVMARPAGTRH